MPYDPAVRNRLPTLFEVLNLRTQAPVDLWCFYVFMREEYRGIEYLDFWLAVVKHLSLCRNYVRGLRQSILASERDMSSSRTSSVLLDTLIQDGTLDDTDSHRLSAFLRGEDAEGNPGSIYRLSALLDTLSTKDQNLATELQQLRTHHQQQQQLLQQQQQQPQQDPQYNLPHPNTSAAAAAWAQEKRRPPTQGSSPIRVVMGSPQTPDRGSSFYFSEKNAQNDGAHSPAGYQPSHAVAANVTPTTNPIPAPTRRGPSATTSMLYDQGLSATPPAKPQRDSEISTNTNNKFPNHVPQPMPSEATTSFVTRNDIKQSTHYILVTYFIPGAEREIVLPQRIMRSVRHAIETEGRDDPEVFDEAREYVFEAMQREAFPAFLAAKALGNMTPFGSVVRLVLGLLAMFAGFWLAFVFILLDWQPKRERCWIILPFAVGVYLICAGLYNLDPLLALLGYSESTSGGSSSSSSANGNTSSSSWRKVGRRLLRVREPYVRQLLVKRSVYVLCVIVAVCACFVVLFALVPGHRL